MTVQRYVKYFKYQNHLNISTLQRLAYFKYFFMGNESENEEPNATKGIISDLDKKKEEVFLFFPLLMCYLFLNTSHGVMPCHFWCG